MLKNTKTYSKFEPWMIGEKVEVSVYEKTEPGVTPELVAVSAGVLNFYALGQGSTEVGFVGLSAEEAMSVRDTYDITIAVLEWQ